MGRVPALDGLCGIAILLVVVFHVWPAVLPAGGYGVTVLFVLSGDHRDHQPGTRPTGTLDLKRFYYRRALRLLPVLGLLCAVMVFVMPWGQIWRTLA